jgi:hypothetical protein
MSNFSWTCPCMVWNARNEATHDRTLPVENHDFTFQSQKTTTFREIIRNVHKFGIDLELTGKLTGGTHLSLLMWQKIKLFVELDRGPTRQSS